MPIHFGINSYSECGAQSGLVSGRASEVTCLECRRIVTERVTQYVAPVCTCRHDSGASSDCAVHQKAAEWSGYPLTWGDEG